MAFESLLHQPTGERELLQQVMRFLQFEFENYQQRFYLIKIEKVDELKSQFTWVKEYASKADYKEECWQQNYHPAAVTFDFACDRYDLFFSGYQIYSRPDVYVDKLDIGFVNESPGDPEEKMLIPREIVEAGLRDLISEFAKVTAKKKKTG